MKRLDISSTMYILTNETGYPAGSKSLYNGSTYGNNDFIHIFSGPAYRKRDDKDILSIIYRDGSGEYHLLEDGYTFDELLKMNMYIYPLRHSREVFRNEYLKTYTSIVDMTRVLSKFDGILKDLLKIHTLYTVEYDKTYEIDKDHMVTQSQEYTIHMCDEGTTKNMGNVPVYMFPNFVHDHRWMGGSRNEIVYAPHVRYWIYILGNAAIRMIEPEIDRIAKNQQHLFSPNNEENDVRFFKLSSAIKEIYYEGFTDYTDARLMSYLEGINYMPLTEANIEYMRVLFEKFVHEFELITPSIEKR
jgi:hypothetical protein